PGGLEPHQVVEGRRHPAGAGGVGAQGKTGKPQGHGHGGTGAGAPGDIVRVEAVAAGPPGFRGAGADEPGGELVEVGLAHRNGAGVEQQPHHEGIRRRWVGKGRAGGGGGNARQIDIVLDGKGNAVEGQFIRRLPRQGREVGRLLGLAQQVDPDIAVAVIRRPGANGGHHLRRSDAAGVAGPQRWDGEGKGRQIEAHSAPSGFMVNSRCPACTGWPGWQRMLSTTPSSGLWTSISIFMDSSTTSTSPLFTRAPGLTSICQILPAASLSTATWPSGSASSWPVSWMGVSEEKLSWPDAFQRCSSSAKACCRWVVKAAISPSWLAT